MNDKHQTRSSCVKADTDFAEVYRGLAAELRVRYGAGGDDLLHDALLKFLRRRESLRHRGAEVSYLRLVLRTTATDNFRARQSQAVALEQYRRAGAATPVEEEPGPTDVDAGLGRGQQREAFAAWLRRSMATLPTPLGEVATAVLVDGESQKGFAERRHLPYSTVKSRLQRARTLLAAAANECCEIRFDAGGRVIDVRPRCCRF